MFSPVHFSAPEARRAVLLLPFFHDRSPHRESALRIDVQHISQPFGIFTTLADVSLHVPDRQHMALSAPAAAAGPPGCA